MGWKYKAGLGFIATFVVIWVSSAEVTQVRLSHTFLFLFFFFCIYLFIYFQLYLNCRWTFIVVEKTQSLRLGNSLESHLSESSCFCRVIPGIKKAG